MSSETEKVTAVLSLLREKLWQHITTLFIVDKRMFVKGKKQLNCYKIVRSYNILIVHNYKQLVESILFHKLFSGGYSAGSKVTLIKITGSTGTSSQPITSLYDVFTKFMASTTSCPSTIAPKTV